MEHKKGHYWIIIVAILIATCIYNIYNNYHLSKDNIEKEAKIDSLHSYYSLIHNNTIKRESIQYTNEGKIINNDIFLGRESVNDSIRISRLLKYNKTLIFDLSSINCMRCGSDNYKVEIENINEISTKVDNRKIIILANYSNISDLKLFKRIYGIDNMIFNKGGEEIGLTIEGYDVPYLAIINSTHTVSHVFVPEQEMPEMTENYFNIISNKFMEK